MIGQTTRRDFLTTAVAATAATALTPFAIRADDKAGSKAKTVGEGEHTYECNHNWCKVPDHIKWFETHGIAVDKSGLVYVAHRGGGELAKNQADAQDTIVVFDDKGNFVRSFGKDLHGGGHGVDIREENGQEYLYLAYMFPVNVTIKTDLKGEVVWRKEKPPEPHVYDNPNARFSPTNVAFHPDGGFFIADGYGSNYIHQYDKDGKWIRTFGGSGDQIGQFKTPHGLWLDNRPGREPMLVVADRANARLQYLTLDGRTVAIEGNVSFPAHFDTQGDILLVADLHARVTLLDKNNKLITHLGYNADWTKTVLDGFKVRGNPSLWQDGKFVHPHDACFDKAGNIYVAEWVATGRIDFLRKVGA